MIAEDFAPAKLSKAQLDLSLPHFVKQIFKNLTL